MKSYAKINIFLKITGFRDNYHEISSRFVLFKDLFDEISFIKKQSDELILGNKIENNIIFKAKKELENLGFKNELDEFFKLNQINLVKNIPMGGGLGGGSSNAAAFLNMTNDELNLGIKPQKLMQIAKNIGADVSFFVSKFDSANVSGIGEVVSEFDDDLPDLKLITSPIFCSTPSVFSKFRSSFCEFDLNLAKNLEKLHSKDILTHYANYELNDLLRPCLELYPNLTVQDNEFLSGSGSTKFSLV